MRVHADEGAHDEHGEAQGEEEPARRHAVHRLLVRVLHPRLVRPQLEVYAARNGEAQQEAHGRPAEPPN